MSDQQDDGRVSRDNVPSPVEMNACLHRLMRGINHQVFAQAGDHIRFGPFMGMQIPEVGSFEDGNESTKLLGSYEQELHPAIEKALERGHETIVNLGCAEGYYAIGLAMRAPGASVVAFDKSQDAVEMTKDYAARNGVAKRVVPLCVEIKEMPIVGKRAFYLIDIEGDELTLCLASFAQPIFAETIAPASDFIIECHDFMNKTISRELRAAFADTHNVELVIPQPPPIERYTMFAQAPTVMALLALTEKRPMPSCWLVAWARQ